jgi:hypothetical protein
VFLVDFEQESPICTRIQASLRFDAFEKPEVACTDLEKKKFPVRILQATHLTS